METDRIERTIFLPAPRARVWQVVANYREFGKWFGIEFNGPFVTGARLQGQVTHPGYEHVRVEITVERVVPEKVLSWRWHPNAVDTTRDYSGEPTTLVSFALEDATSGTQLTVVESGFDNIPVDRREAARHENVKAWNMQMDSIRQYVSMAA
jgi:uncharacterized protein YndB with AHSA1/START domain